MKKLIRNSLVFVTTLIMALSLVAGLPAATVQAAESAEPQPVAESAEGDSVYDYDEEQTENTSYPSAFDLRHVGGTVSYNDGDKQSTITGGVSYVTPVKFQNPWGTCWAFGINAAAEISILYELGEGTEDTIGGNTNLDLSEHHLAWFAKNHIPAEGEEGYEVNDVNAQDGEGYYYFSGVSSANMESGMPYLGASVYAAGMGAVLEQDYPYVGANKQVKAKRNKGVDTEFFTEKYLYFDSVEAWEAIEDEVTKNNYQLFCYSEKDNWQIEESERFVQTYKLEESNILPSAAGTWLGTYDENGNPVVTLNQDGINAVKEELLAGKGVEAAFYADASDPNVDNDSRAVRYINSNYAHFTWDKTNVIHSVCIVGWDDNYSADNFGVQDPIKYDSKGRPLYVLRCDETAVLQYSADESYLYLESQPEIHYSMTDDAVMISRETGKCYKPSGDGAWIVKNSWGASSEYGNTFANENTWGVDGSGYFYLSYYDTSINNLETYDFIVTDEDESEYDYSIVDEYDLMPALSTNQIDYDDPVRMANVFTAEEDMEITAVSCQTTTPGTQVTYQICLLNDGEDYPTASDKMISVTSEPVTYQYGGYHRQALDTPVQVQAGRKYAVIVTETYEKTDATGQKTKMYAICSNTGWTEQAAKDGKDNSYIKGIVNQGESYMIWEDESGQIGAKDFSDEVYELESENLYLSYDNFSIKAYANPCAIEKTVTAVKTGDTSGLWLWLVILATAILTAGTVLWVKVRKN